MRWRRISLPYVGCPLSLPYGPCWPIASPGGFGNPSAHSVFTRYLSELFRCLNNIVQYINLYVSTILKLLVMYVISSGTPNKLRPSNHIVTHNTNRHRTLSVQTLRVQEMTETHLRSITNSRTWMLILAPTYSTKIFIGQTA